MLASLALGGLLAHATLSAQAAQQAQQQPADSRLWYEAYDDGVEQVGAGNYQAAVASLQAALARRPEQGPRINFYGGRIGAYIPDYYLGVAYLGLGQYEQAEAAFERARDNGLVRPQDDLYEEFQQQASSARAEASLARATRRIDQGDIDGATEELRTAEGLGVEEDRLAPLQARLDDSKAPDPTPPPPDDLEPDAPEPDPPSPLPDPAGDPGPVVVPEDAGPAPAPPPRDAAIDPPVRRPLPIPTTPLAEQAAIAAFFGGRYGEAADALAALIAGGGESPRVHFYRAVSLAALAVTTGDDGASAIQEARGHLATARAAAGLDADRRLVSPRLLTLLEGTQ